MAYIDDFQTSSYIEIEYSDTPDYSTDNKSIANGNCIFTDREIDPDTNPIIATVSGGTYNITTNPDMTTGGGTYQPSTSIGVYTTWYISGLGGMADLSIYSTIDIPVVVHTTGVIAEFYLEANGNPYFIGATTTGGTISYDLSSVLPADITSAQFIYLTIYYDPYDSETSGIPWTIPEGQNLVTISPLEVNTAGAVEYNEDITSAIAFISSTLGGNFLEDFTTSYMSVGSSAIFSTAKAAFAQSAIAISSFPASATQEVVSSVLTYISSIINSSVIHNLESVMTLADSIVSAANINNSIESQFNVQDLIAAVLNVLVADSMSFGSEAALNLSLISLVKETINMLDAVANSTELTRSTASTISISGFTSVSYQDIINSFLALESALKSTYLANAKSTATLMFSGSSKAYIESDKSASSHLIAVDSIYQNLTASSSAESSVIFSGILTIEGVDYLAVALNVSNRGITEYTNYNFNSFGLWNNDYYGASSVGIYKLNGNDDDGVNISSTIQTGFMDFNTANQKVIPECYLGYTSDGDLIIKLYNNEQGQKQEIWYELLRTKDAPDTDRYTMAKGAKGRYLQFELINKDGSDFDLETIEFFPVILSRRIR